MSDRQYRSAVVLGLGASGLAATRLLRHEGVSVSVLDERSPAELGQEVEHLASQGATVRAGRSPGGGDLPLLESGTGIPDICIVSPGVRAGHPWLQEARDAGVPIISELELGASRCHLPILAITGSNGKSTLVKLCGLALELAGLRPVLAGNYGKPLCDVAMEQASFDRVVAEVSSFQLEHVRAFSPVAGVLLNVAPDHLDRHGDMEAYTQMKARLFHAMPADGIAVVEDSLRDVVSGLNPSISTWRTFGHGLQVDYRYQEGRITSPGAVPGPELELAGTVFDNPVMGLTASAALAVLTGLGIPCDALQAAVRSFEPLPHRMQPVAEKAGVLFIDDSKATNLAAMCGALQMVSRPVRLVAGGQFKEKDTGLPKELLAKTTKSTYLLGESAQMLGKAWGDVVACNQCGILSQAVKQAWREAEPGDVVLLSPGCASFDQFSGYHERGQVFQSVVAELSASRANSRADV